MKAKTKTSATKEEAKPALVPKLRFPEFQGADGWKNAPLGTLLMKSPDYGVNAAAVPFAEGLPQYLRITDISDDGAYLSAKKVSVDLTPTEEIFLDEGDIVLARTGASVGKSYRYRKEDGRLVFAGFLIRVRPNPKRLDSTYLANFLTTNRYWKWVAATSARSGQPGINSVEYGSLEIPLPAAFAEQQKIAECVSSVDELIADQARKVDALKTHKKGLMQQLFPREGETQPRLRFPEFRNDGEWDSKPLGDLGEIITGKTPSTKEADLWGGDILFITPTDISEDSKYQHTAARTVVETKSTKVLPAGSIVYTCIASIGKMALTVTTSITNQQINAVVPNKRALGEFLYYALANLTPWIKTIPATNTLPIINKTDFSKIAILHPGKAEQHRIATCLSSLDALITAETQKHEALKTHKKGLMQQLFPSPGEVAG